MNSEIFKSDINILEILQQTFGTKYIPPTVNNSEIYKTN